MIDIHSHLLPGVDDGSPSIEVSVRVLERFVAEGVRTVICTPHLDASRASTAPYRRYLEILDALRAASPHGIDLRLGWEIMLDQPNVDLSDFQLTLDGSRALLVEFSRGGVPRTGGEELQRIVRSGRTPVLAHPERYFGCTLELVHQWRAAGTVIQTDVSVLMGRGAPADFARRMLEHGYIDILASDNHGDDRSLAAAPAWLASQGADEQVELLTHVNAARLLAGEEVMAVPPLPPRGVGAMLRRIFHS